MKFLFSKSLFLALPACFLALTMGSASGQAAKVVGEKPIFEDLQSPMLNLAVGKDKAFKPKDWLEIEAKLKVSLSPEPKSKACDKITVKWYVAVKNTEKSGSYLLLTKDIEYVNIPLEEEIFCSVYLSPSSIKRLTGQDKAGKNCVELVGYEVLVNGTKVFEESNKNKPGWWNAASDKISRSDSVPLLTKNDTPFKMMWWDRYAELGSDRR
jgi:hypothetical protein